MTYIGSSHLERAKSVFPLHTFTWLPLVYSGFTETSLLAGVFLTTFIIIFTALIARPHENRIRESKWVDRINQKISPSDSPIIIVGNDHLNPLAQQLMEQGYETDTISLLENTE